MAYRKPKSSPNTLKISYGKLAREEPALIYTWGEGIEKKDINILHYHMGKDKWVNGRIEESMFKALEKAGYDITTLKFSIKKKV